MRGVCDNYVYYVLCDLSESFSAFTDNYYLDILSVTNLNSAGKFPQNGIEVAN